MRRRTWRAFKVAHWGYHHKTLTHSLASHLKTGYLSPGQSTETPCQISHTPSKVGKGLDDLLWWLAFQPDINQSHLRGGNLTWGNAESGWSVDEPAGHSPD